MSRHAVIKVRLRAVIDRFTFTDVVQYTATWGLNSIPMASILVAVGRNVVDQKLATIHEAAKELTSQLKAEVFLETIVQSVNEADAGVPVNGEIKIFEGKIVGTGWHRAENGAHFTIHMLHWLGDLNYASSVSGSLHPGSHADLTYPAVFPAIGLDSKTPNSSPVPSWVPNLSSSDVNEGSFSDIWGNILQKWLIQISSSDPYDRAVAGSDGAPTAEILDALNRLSPNPDGVPLDFEFAGLSILKDAMRQALINEIGGSWINTTLWGKIIGEWAPAYWFSVVPRVEDALIVPFTGGLQGAPWAVIGDEDYSYAALNAQLQQVLRAVGIVHPAATATGFDLGINIPQVNRGGFFGLFQPTDTKHGLILLKDAPKWLSDPIVVHLLSANAENITGTLPIGTALDETIPAPTEDEPAGIADNIRQMGGIASAYAQQWYVLESLKGRTGEVVGKLRFDIAPGSNVLVIAGGARNVPEAQAVTEDIYATVVQVSYVINAEGQRAGTAFSLDHIRTSKENTSLRTSVPKPPLYKNGWPGAKLVPAAPGPEQAR